MSFSHTYSRGVLVVALSGSLPSPYMTSLIVLTGGSVAHNQIHHQDNTALQPLQQTISTSTQIYRSFNYQDRIWWLEVGHKFASS